MWAIRGYETSPVNALACRRPGHRHSASGSGEGVRDRAHCRLTRRRSRSTDAPMSNALMKACRSFRMPPPAKAVLMALADRADDSGSAWPSLETLSSDTCFGRTAVIGAVKWLETTGAVVVDRSNGRKTAYRLTPEHFDPSAARTGPRAEPVRVANGTSPPGVPDPSATRTKPVRQADTNHQEPKGTQREPSTRGSVELVSFGRFWDAYPKRIAKQAAERAWQKQRCEPFAERIIAAVLERAAGDPQWKRDGGQYIPNASTYLNQRRWEDQWKPANCTFPRKPSLTSPIDSKVFDGDADNVVEQLLPA